MKKIIHKLHLWSGLTMGLFLFLIAFSGTVLTYQKELIALANATEFTSVHSENKSLDELVRKIESTVGRPSALIIASHPSTFIKAIVKKDLHDRRGQIFFVSVDGESIVKEGERLKSFFMFFFRLHRWLLLDTPVGRPIVGWLTILFTFLLISGLYLWWPRNLVGLKRALSVRLRGNFKRLNYDLHNSLGFYALPLMLLMTLTGLCWSFESYKDALSAILGARVFGDRQHQSIQLEMLPQERQSLDSIFQKAQLLNPSKGEWLLDLESKENESVILSFIPKGLLILRGRSRFEWNPYTGELIKRMEFGDKSIGEKIASLIHDLHTGDAFGDLFKFIYFMASLVASSLPLTGALIWFNKKK